MARSNVPKFGNWGNEDNVPYTVYFDKARKKKGGKMINPNDPQENPDMFPNIDPTSPAPPPKPKTRTEEPIGRGSVRPEHKESDHFRQLNNSPAARSEQIRPASSARRSGGSDKSFERSPLHPHYQAEVVMGRGGGSPTWLGRTVDGNHGNPIIRSRLMPARGDESPYKGAAVPRFGEWNENDPQSAENFTHIFNKVRNERNTAGIENPSPATPNKHPSHSTSTQPSGVPKKCCFIPWW